MNPDHWGTHKHNQSACQIDLHIRLKFIFFKTNMTPAGCSNKDEWLASQHSVDSVWPRWPSFPPVRTLSALISRAKAALTHYWPRPPARAFGWASFCLTHTGGSRSTSATVCQSVQRAHERQDGPTARSQILTRGVPSALPFKCKVNCGWTRLKTWCLLRHFEMEVTVGFSPFLDTAGPGRDWAAAREKWGPPGLEKQRSCTRFHWATFPGAPNPERKVERGRC